MTTATPPRAGYHFISGLQLAAQQAPLQLSRDKSKQLGRALFAQTEREKAAVLNCLLRNRHLREENPVRVVTKVSDSTGAMSTTPASTVLHHDFRSRPSLTVVLTLRLLNTSWNRAVQCQLELLDTNKSDPTSSAATTAFHWIGMTSTHITLAPGEEKTISTHALIMRTGTHDLNRWRVVVNMTGDGQAVGDASCESTFVHVPGSPCYVEVRAPQLLHSVIGVSEIGVEPPPQKSVITVE